MAKAAGCGRKKNLRKSAGPANSPRTQNGIMILLLPTGLIWRLIRKQSGRCVAGEEATWMLTKAIGGTQENENRASCKNTDSSLW